MLVCRGVNGLGYIKYNIRLFGFVQMALLFSSGNVVGVFASAIFFGRERGNYSNTTFLK